MLKQITWEQYLLFVTAALLVYYFFIWLLYYRDGMGKTAFNLTGRQAERRNDNEAAKENLLGEPVEEFGISTLNSDELYFGSHSGYEQGENFEAEEWDDENQETGQKDELSLLEDETGKVDIDELLQGDIADLLEDTKLVFHFIKEHQPDDRDGLVSRVTKKVELYPRILQSELLELVLQDICDKVQSELNFKLSPAEIKAAITYNEDYHKASFFSKKGKS